MSRIEDLVERLCPGGVPVRTLGEVGTFIRGKGIQKTDLTEEGVPAIHYGEIHRYYGTSATKTRSFVDPDLAVGLRLAEPGDLVIATTSEDDEGVGKAIAWLGESQVAVSVDAYIYRHTLDPMYAAYLFQSRSFHTQKRRSVNGTKVRRISGDKLSKIEFPVPPREIQEEIVRVLELFQSLERSLQTELVAERSARMLQFSHYRQVIMTALVDGENRQATLGDICTRVSSGGTPSSGRAEYYGGDIPWLRTQDINYFDIETTSAHITEAGLRDSSANWIPAWCVIVAMYGATAAKVAVNAIPLTTNQACCNLEVDPAQAEYRYVFHWIANEYVRLRALGEGSQSNLNAKKIKDYPIPVPSLERQREIVETLDRFDALVNELSMSLSAEVTARRGQYEHYRDRMLTFEGATA